jgi:hypothetical protein
MRVLESELSEFRGDVRDGLLRFYQDVTRLAVTNGCYLPQAF